MTLFCHIIYRSLTGTMCTNMVQITQIWVGLGRHECFKDLSSLLNIAPPPSIIDWALLLPANLLSCSISHEHCPDFSLTNGKGPTYRVRTYCTGTGLFLVCPDWQKDPNKEIVWRFWAMSSTRTMIGCRWGGGSSDLECVGLDLQDRHG